MRDLYHRLLLLSDPLISLLRASDKIKHDLIEEAKTMLI